MKPTTKNRWLKLLAWLWAIVIIVMLLIPTELTDAQLTQIQQGMQIADVKRLLGDQSDRVVVIRYSSEGTYWVLERKWWKPSLESKLEVDAKATLDTSNWSVWHADTKLLWVEHHNGIVTKTWLFPITRTGGGLEGCIDTIKQYWNHWWK